MSFEGKSQEEIGKWTEYCLKKENGPRASSAPALELNTIIFKHVYWYMQQISGERLQTIGPLVLFLLLNIDCGYSLEPPRRGGSNGRGGYNVYPQSMFSLF